MSHYVQLRLHPASAVLTAGAGAIVGRGSTREIVLPDPRVSEVHAFVAERRGLVLLAARGGLWEDGQPVDEVPLRPGRRIDLVADGSLSIEVVEESTIGEPMALMLDGSRPVALRGDACHILPDRDPWLVNELPAGADPLASFLQADGVWQLLRPAGGVDVVEHGRQWSFGNHKVLVWSPHPELPPTTLVSSTGAAPRSPELTIRFSAASVALTRIQPAVLQLELDGKLASLLHELTGCTQPVKWADVAARPSLWEARSKPHDTNWYNAISRLRKELEKKLAWNLDDLIYLPRDGTVTWVADDRVVIL